jgi:hypothetical protein
VLQLQLVGFCNDSHSDLDREFAVAVEEGEDGEGGEGVVALGGRASRGRAARKVAGGKAKPGKAEGRGTMAGQAQVRNELWFNALYAMLRIGWIQARTWHLR